MTTRFEKHVKCANCGRERDIIVIGSTSSFGYSDLDTRPAPLARYIQEDLVDYCPDCCYASYNIEKITDEVKKVIDTKEYIDFIYSFPYNTSIRGYMGIGYINLKLGKFKEAFHSFLEASWIYDDMSLKKRLKDITNVGRDYSLNLFDKHLSNTEEVALHLINLDQLRRNKDFDKAKERALGILNKFSSKLEDMERKIVEFQLKLIEEKDTRVYTVENALNDK